MAATADSGVSGRDASESSEILSSAPWLERSLDAIETTERSLSLLEVISSAELELVRAGCGAAADAEAGRHGVGAGWGERRRARFPRLNPDGGAGGDGARAWRSSALRHSYACLTSSPEWQPKASATSFHTTLLFPPDTSTAVTSAVTLTSTPSIVTVRRPRRFGRARDFGAGADGSSSSSCCDGRG